jgi:hypothetical protein
VLGGLTGIGPREDTEQLGGEWCLKAPMPATTQPPAQAWSTGYPQMGMSWIDVYNRNLNRGVYFGDHDPHARIKSVRIDKRPPPSAGASSTRRARTATASRPGGHHRAQRALRHDVDTVGVVGLVRALHDPRLLHREADLLLMVPALGELAGGVEPVQRPVLASPAHAEPRGGRRVQRLVVVAELP